MSVRGGLERVAAATLLVIVAPLIAWAAWRVRKDGGPAFYSQERVKKHEKTFHLLKLRSMHVDAEERLAALLAGNPELAASWKAFRKLPDDQDPRITKIGRFIRETAIDELPQLWHVVTGDMRVVGPRPARPEEYQTEFGRYRSVYSSLKPGLISPLMFEWDPVNRKDRYSRKVASYVLYKRRRSLWLDIRLLLICIRVIAQSRNSVEARPEHLK